MHKIPGAADLGDTIPPDELHVRPTQILLIITQYAESKQTGNKCFVTHLGVQHGMGKARRLGCQQNEQRISEVGFSSFY